MNPFHKWILDVRVSLLFENQIKLKAARLSFSVFIFLMLFIHAKKNQNVCDGAQNRHITQGREYATF